MMDNSAWIESQGKIVRQIVVDKSLSIVQKRDALRLHMHPYVSSLVLSGFRAAHHNVYEYHVNNGISAFVTMSYLAKVAQILHGKPSPAVEEVVPKGFLSKFSLLWEDALRKQRRPHVSLKIVPRLALQAEVNLLDEVLCRLAPAEYIGQLSAGKKRMWAAQTLALSDVCSLICLHNSKHLKTVNLSLTKIPIKDLQVKIGDRVASLCKLALDQDSYKTLRPAVKMLGYVKSL